LKRSAATLLFAAGHRAAEDCDLRSNAFECGVEVVHDELRLEPEHATPEAGEGAIPPSIGARPWRMRGPIDFDHEAQLGNVQVRDEAPCEWHLPSKGHAEPPAADGFEESCFGSRRSVAHLRGALFENQ
jgi:hypothetical protein